MSIPKDSLNLRKAKREDLRIGADVYREMDKAPDFVYKITIRGPVVGRQQVWSTKKGKYVWVDKEPEELYKEYIETIKLWWEKGKLYKEV